MKKKNILTLGLSLLLLAGCGGNGKAITLDEAKTQATTMAQKVAEEGFEVPKVSRMVADVDMKSSLYSSTTETELIQDLDKFYFSVKANTSGITEEGPQNKVMEMYLFVDGTKLVMASNDGENKKYMQQDAGSIEAAKQAFSSAYESIGYQVDVKSMTQSAYSSIEETFDAERIKNELTSAFGGDADATCDISASSKGESHLYLSAKANASGSFEMDGITYSYTASSNAELEFDNYLITKMNEEASAVATGTFLGQTVTDESVLKSNATFEYNCGYSRVDLSSYTLATL